MANDIAEKNPTISGLLKQYQSQIAAALPKHMTADRMARIALTEVRKSNALSKANPVSLFGAVIQAAQLGLEPGGALGHAYLVPYKGEVQLIVGYRGMIDLARRSGQMISLTAHVVYEHDEFTYSYGLHEDLVHRPAEDPRGNAVYVYAVARLVGGGVQFQVMSWDAVMQIRDGSEGYRAFKANKIRSNPWESHPEEMAKKTVIRRLFKYLPVSIEIQRAVALDESMDAGVSQANAAVIDGEFMVTEEEEGATSLRDQVQRKSEAEPPASEGSQGGGDTSPLASLLDRVMSASDAEALDLIRSEAKEALAGAEQKSALKTVQDAVANKMKSLQGEGEVA